MPQSGHLPVKIEQILQISGTLVVDLVPEIPHNLHVQEVKAGPAVMFVLQVQCSFPKVENPFLWMDSIYIIALTNKTVMSDIIAIIIFLFFIY